MGWVSTRLGHYARRKNRGIVQLWRSKSLGVLDQHSDEVHVTVEGLVWKNQVLRCSPSAGTTEVEGFIWLNFKNGNMKNHETFR